jgi:hypothetical protein
MCHVMPTCFLRVPRACVWSLGIPARTHVGARSDMPLHSDERRYSMFTSGRVYYLWSLCRLEKEKYGGYSRRLQPEATAGCVLPECSCFGRQS